MPATAVSLRRSRSRFAGRLLKGRAARARSRLPGPRSSLAEARLDQLEVGEAGEAELSSEGQSDQQLRPHQRPEQWQAEDDTHQRDDSNYGLVEPGRARIDHFGVSPGVRCVRFGHASSVGREIRRLGRCGEGCATITINSEQRGISAGTRTRALRASS
jgi:hypothetical protein